MNMIYGTSKIISAAKNNQENLEQKPKIEKEETSKKSRTTKVMKFADEVKDSSLKIAKQTMNHPLVAKQTKKVTQSISKARILMPVLDKSLKCVDFSIDYMMNKNIADNANRSEVMQYTRSPAVFGIWVSAITLLVSIIWGVVAPLNSAAEAQGQIVLESKKRVIQHHGGGHIQRIYVKNGDEVEQGEILIKLDKTAALAKRDSYKNAVLTFEAENARLVAERDDLSDLKFSEQLLKQAGNPEIAKILLIQQKYFKAKKETIAGKEKVRLEKIKQYESRKNSNQQQLDSINSQLNLAEDTYNSYVKLHSSGSISKEALRKQESTVSELRGKKAYYEGQVSEMTDEIVKENFEIQNDKTGLMAEVEKELRQNQSQLYANIEALKEAEDLLAKLDITSPISGKVNNFGTVVNSYGNGVVVTEGGVLPNDVPIMEIIPKDDKLVMDIKIRAQDIDIVREGHTVSIRLAPFKSRVVPPLDGHLISIAPDISMPSQGEAPEPYYRGRVEIDEKSIQKIKQLDGVDLYPGMPGSVMIVVGTRTFLQYLMDPITTSFGKAFIEQ